MLPIIVVCYNVCSLHSNNIIAKTCWFKVSRSSSYIG